MTRDRNGQVVNVGAQIRIVQIAEFLKRDLPREEWARLQGMVGQVFAVTEIDDAGRAWVEKWFDEADGQRISHSIALDSHEMELVSQS